MVVYGHSCDCKFLDILFTRKGTALVSEVCRRHIYTGIYHHLESDHPPYIKVWLFTGCLTEQITSKGPHDFHSEIAVIKHESLKFHLFSYEQTREEEKPYPSGWETC